MHKKKKNCNTDVHNLVDKNKETRYTPKYDQTVEKVNRKLQDRTTAGGDKHHSGDKYKE